MPYKNPPQCSRHRCTKPVVARGLCRMHYSRVWRREKGQRPAKYMSAEHRAKISTAMKGSLRPQALDDYFAFMTAKERSQYFRKIRSFVLPMLNAGECEWCGQLFDAVQPTRRVFCSGSCQLADWRHRKRTAQG